MFTSATVVPAVFVLTAAVTGCASIDGRPSGTTDQLAARLQLQNAQFGFPTWRRITVNLAPEDLPKESGASTCCARISPHYFFTHVES